MTAPQDPDDEALARTIFDEASRALGTGALAAAAVAALGFVGVGTLALSKPWLRIPAVTVATFALYALALSALARRKLLSVNAMRVGLLIFTTLPFLALALCEPLLPFGTATFIYGPISLVFMVVVILSGLTFDERLARMAGVQAGLLYLAAHAIARPHLQSLTGLDEGFFHDISDGGVAALRALVIAGTGFLTGAAASTSKRLILRVRDEERERQALNGLFGQYVSTQVRDKLVREKAGLQGEKVTVAVLFSDLRGFTTFSETKTPAELVTRLNQYFDRMVAAISANGGVVDKFIGDAVMAVFGGVLPLERPADSALAAARAMRAELAALNAQWTAQGLEPLDTGIGIHFGEVLQGPIGSAQRKEFTVIGDTVNTASRLEGATKELHSPIVLSAAAAEALAPDGRATLTPLGEVRLKGKEKPVAVFGAQG